MTALKEQGLRFIPLAIGAPMGTPLGPSPCGRFITIPLLGRINHGEQSPHLMAGRG